MNPAINGSELRRFNLQLCKSICFTRKASWNL